MELLDRQPSENARSYALRVLLHNIITLELAPGSAVSENELSQILKLSRTPVREALRSLASEGFLEIKNGVGAYVKPLSSKDMENLYEIRCLLEMQAIKTSIYRITDQEIDDMERRFQAVYDACERGEHPEHGEFSTWTGTCTVCWWTTAPTLYQVHRGQ